MGVNSLQDRYLPNVVETHVVDVEVDGNHLELALWRTFGEEEYEQLRALSYSNSDVILICFAIDSPDSLDNVVQKVRPPSATDNCVADSDSGFRKYSNIVKGYQSFY
jgi:GTPase SAR1 family protein